MTEVIRCRALTKRYGSTVAVDGLDLAVEAGVKGRELVGG